MLLQVAENGGIEEMIFNSKGFMKGVYTYNGSLTNAAIGRRFNIKFKDLNLLMAARF